MASTYLTRTPSSTGNRKKWTWSGWVKKTRVGGSLNKELMSANNGSNQFSLITFTTTDQLSYYDYTTGYSSHLITNRLFRDTSAWSHIVVAYDSAQSTSSNRIKFYVNGVQETSFGTSTYPSQNYDSFMNLSSLPHYIGREDGTSNLYEGSMTHIHFCDGYAYDASSFGESDSVSGIWKPKTAPSVTYGTNGFFLKFENSGAMGTDSSGNSNTFAVGGGTLTQNVDTPSNNFATWNIIMNNAEDGNWSNGNLTIAPNGDGTYLYAPTTIGVSSGKWYSEHMITGGNGYGMLGAISEDNIVDGFRQQTVLGTLTNSFGFRCRDGAIRMASSNTTYGSAPGTSDAILGMALDMDNKKVWYHINGTYVTYGGGVGNPASGTYGFDFSSLTGSTFLITCGDDTASGYGNFKSNFGSGYFGTAAVASAGTAPSEGGIFEYDCPTGFQALCTKGINSF